YKDQVLEFRKIIGGKVVTIEDLVFVISHERTEIHFCGKVLSIPDKVIVRVINPECPQENAEDILHQLEMLGVRFILCPEHRLSFYGKVAQAQILALNGIPIPTTVVASSNRMLADITGL